MSCAKGSTELLAQFQNVKPNTSYLLNEKRINALKACDHGALASMDNELVKDSEPLYTMITDQGENAFNKIKDEHGRDVYICATEHAALWVYANDSTADKPASLEVGVMSANGGQASSTLLDALSDQQDHIIIGSLAVGIGAVVGKQITAALTKRAAEAAEIVAAGIARDDAYKILSAARKNGDPGKINSAIQRLGNARKSVDKLWMKNIPKGGMGERIMQLATKYPKLSGFLGGTIVSIVMTIAFEIIWHYINKDLFVSTRIYNWDTRAWEIDDWYHDNGILVGDVDFEKKQIPAAGMYYNPEIILYKKVQLTRIPVKTQPTPWGDRLGTWTSVKFVEYSFQNSTLTPNIPLG
jgi:hypothetical protein